MNELMVITTYYNPCRYKLRRINYDRFITGLRSAGVSCLTVECAFNGDEYELQPALDVVRIKSTSLLWQKERLLNLAASWLPREVRYVAWLDCDILFDNQHWAEDLVSVLKLYPIAQVFETAKRLDRTGHGEADPMATSFAAVMRDNPNALEPGRYDKHGHTGYGWAMRREIFDDVGLYESAISGSADHFMAHAIFNHYGFCVENALKHDQAQIEHLKAWGARFYEHIQGQLGVVPGQITHLWHGDTVNRRYFLRMHEITDLGFNPFKDIIASPGRPLEWSSSASPGLKSYFSNYFTSRQEDGA